MLMSQPRKFVLFACLIGSAAFSQGCIPVKQARVAAVAFTVQDVAKAAAKQPDPTIVREGTPAYLMLVDGLLEAYPDNEELLVAASQAYGSYASSFLAEEDRQTSEAIYGKAKRYGFRALSVSGGVDFGKASSGNLEEFTLVLQEYNKKDVPALFWTASAWASWISANISSVEAMADIPMLEALIRRVLELDESFYYGGPHLLMGVFLAAKPAVMGGDPVKARQHFDRAFALGSGKILMAKVLYAQYYARETKDRALFESLLHEVEKAPADEVPELTLANVIAKEKAKRLLNKTEEYFGPQL
jgi:hypothetical protein